jgi:hypothetical protein
MCWRMGRAPGDGSEIDDSNEAEDVVGEMGGDRLASKSTSTSGIGGESRAMSKSSVLSLMGTG